MEEKGQNARVDTPGSSSTAERHEITTILSGESAFLYGNVLSEGPEDCDEPTSSGGNYDWASREVSDFRSLFRNRVVLADWVENSYILRTLGYSSCVKLVACRENERVFHGRENATHDFFYCYASPFYDLYVRLPLTNFQMEVLRTLNVAPTQLHPNSWGYMQAFAVMCQALAIRPTVALFLRFFRCRPVAKKGRTYFFDEDGNPKFPLYWTQDPLRFTLWAEDKMTIEELEALSVLTALPRPFSSRRLINCLEHDDFDSRIMGRKGSVRNWFQAIDAGKAGAGCPSPSSKPTQAFPPPSSVRLASRDDVVVVEEQPLVRKWRGKAVDTTDATSKKMKETIEETDRPLPNGVWDPSFNLSHKIEFNLDNSEKKVVESMTEQQMADAMLEMASRTAMAAWHMAYASDRGVLRVELEKARTQLKELTEVHASCDQKERQSEKLLCEAQVLLNGARSAGLALKKERDDLQRERNQVVAELEQSKKTVAALTKERDDLRAAAVEDQEIREEMTEAIILEHTRGFKKALRQVAHLLQVSTEGVAFDMQKDLYQGQMRPLGEIPENAFLEAEDGVDDETAAVEEPKETTAAEEPIAETVGESGVGSPNIVID
ncbi:hypothetical protein LR48_Vigan09g099200 [Vigna angularis]|uniref:Transposase (putative) gypsy type domain-containing protein n=1 Tax=Phaseolus angularis TaxID=3914 RepID=A0A0L9VBE3_PHAAN|nr:hypothetical protein LR48_Vigan09g099200 [Vigna angularis]